ncbi:MAG TPA: alcohol dehydrogenase, partial [Flavobacteriaceae bacterium]|nr:alcohol dehydrogenase [Flavobacteriaceae bacterium]
MNFKNFPMVSNVVFGRGSFSQIDEIIAPKRQNELAPFIYLIDDVFKENEYLLSKISLAYYDYIIFISSEEEPKTSQVDAMVEQIILNTKSIPSG